MQGPRTLKWVLAFMLENGPSAMGWHHKWKADCKLQDSDAGVDAHETYCRVLQTMASYDQLDLGNLAGVELMVRQLQLVEERHKDRLGGSSGKDSLDEKYLFAGSAHRNNLCVCPKLQEWVGEEMRKESLIMKERRKAREERGLARPPPKGPKG